MENWRRSYLGLERMPADLSYTVIAWYFNPDKLCKLEIQAPASDNALWVDPEYGFFAYDRQAAVPAGQGPCEDPRLCR